VNSLITCLIVFSSLCLSDARAIEISPPNSIARNATIRVGDATVQVILSQDGLSNFAPALMSRACQDDACLSYHKWCEDTPEAVTCRYTIAGIPYAGWLTLTARNRAAIDEAERFMAILPTPGDATKQVPLTLLSVVATDSRPPFCRRNDPRRIFPQCPE
jgi:hypothetical protein